jgi:hypothetical protein
MEIMFFFVLRHPTYHHVLHECIVECPILSSKYEHVPISHRGVGIHLLGLKQLAKHHSQVTHTPCKAPKKP